MKRKLFLVAISIIAIITTTTILAYRQVHQQNQDIHNLEQLKQEREIDLEKTKSDLKNTQKDKERLQKKSKQQIRQIKELNKKLQAKRKVQQSLAAAALDRATFTHRTYAQPIPSGSLATWLSKLRACESGGNYQINTGNGYYGAYQFAAATWNHWDTGYSYAHLAPASVQDATIIKNTKASSGGLATQNPGCMQSQGLSAFPPSG